MQVAVTASDRQWEELTGCSDKIEWIRIADDTGFIQNTTAAAFFNLNSDKIHPAYSSLDRPVFINAVSTTLKELNAPANVLRINGWNGFLQRPTWEIAGVVDDKASAVLTQLNKIIITVADEPGLVCARIIAMIINEAWFAVGDEVSSREEIDTAMKLGTNYPFGPFEWATAIGAGNILELLNKLTVTDKRYQPAPLLIKEAAANNS